MKKSIFMLSLAASFVLAAEVNLYTARHYDADQKLYDAFEKKTGIKVNATQAKAPELIKKLEVEGDSSVADVFITADVGNFQSAKDKNLLAPVSSEYLNKIIPENLRDKENLWFGLTKRARVIVYDKDKFDPVKFGVKNYEDLAKPELKGKLLMRSGSSGYNKSLVAGILAHDGEMETSKWLDGVVANLAREPKGGDRDQIKAIAAGEGLIAVSNTYYIGLMLNSPKEEDVQAAKQIKVLFPNQDSYGTHVNISGMAMTKSSKNKAEAVKFMEFLVTPEAQEILTGINYEYPINKDVKPSQTIADFGEFKEDKLSLNTIGENQKAAAMLTDKAGWK